MNYKIVVNKEYLYDKNDFQNRKLKKVKNILGEEFLLESRTLNAYLALKEYLAKQSIFITITSGYRTLEKQEEIIKDFQDRYGDDYTKQYVALPNTSEHHTGLCFDVALIIDDKVILENNEAMKYESTWQHIFEILPLFGLILRYPKGKETITSYQYEPWHFRYVSKNTASIIMKNHLTLEEYDKIYHKSGILLVDKPKGLTSRDIVNQVSKIFDTTKVGHNGTLDPMATGLLVITINKATKINEYLTATDKEYIATVEVGYETNTFDKTGKVINKENQEIDINELKRVISTFPREYEQTVPVYSAIKKSGKKLYEYAREGQEVELPKRKVLIKELELLDSKKCEFTFRAVVSKGTYIRSLVQDIGKELNLYCTLSELKRTRQGKFLLEDAVAFHDVTVQTPLLSIGESLSFPLINLDKETYDKVKNGMAIPNKYLVEKKVLLVYDNFLAIYEKKQDRLVACKILN